jgi:hypothetical protein
LNYNLNDERESLKNQNLKLSFRVTMRL